MARKTINVADVKQWANNFLAADDSFTCDGIDAASRRLGVAGLLETVLHHTDNYNGFQYLPSEFLPADEQTDGNVLRHDYDGTRRHYF